MSGRTRPYVSGSDPVIAFSERLAEREPDRMERVQQAGEKLPQHFDDWRDEFIASGHGAGPTQPTVAVGFAHLKGLP